MNDADDDMTPTIRHRIRVRGVVQGVGFRPAIYRLATGAALTGFVRNDRGGVVIEIEGESAAVEDFPRILRAGAPPQSVIEGIEIEQLMPCRDDRFRVAETVAESEAAEALIPPDLATCDACLGELFDPGNRRYRYPFINCTDCGPRYTIVQALPYDRRQTTMQPFALCPECRSEYENPADRRFHAEPNACPRCGPSLQLLDRTGTLARGDEVLERVVAALEQGYVVAIKGIGGFHLAADSRNADAVRRLRQRKQRPSKPLAVMARDLEIASTLGEVGAGEVESLCSPQRPIVLLSKKNGAPVADGIAPGLDVIGVMLPYAPLHHLLLRDGPPVLIMTSGNLSGDPIVIDDTRATALLEIADLVVTHDRKILNRADDSVVRVFAGTSRPIRRSRGSVPRPIDLGFDAQPILGVGAELKNTVCVTRGSAAYLSPHIGDLASVESLQAFEEAIDHLQRLLDVAPAAVAHDLHPDYHSTRWALESGLQRVPVQHHHAHVVSCCIDNGFHERVIGVAFDGTGCGPSGELWGGEFLVADLNGFERRAWLRPLRLPGGEMAIRQPWRLAAAALIDAGEPLDLLDHIDPKMLGPISRLAGNGFAAPEATSAGRWFDAIAALCGIRDEISYEAQAAVELEAIAADSQEAYPFVIEKRERGQEVDLRPVVRAVAADLRSGVDLSLIAGRFHQTLAQIVAAVALSIRDDTGPSTVALSGGCFQNRRLTEAAVELLRQRQFDVLLHRNVPPNDGGVSLGQVAIAAKRLS